MIKKITQNLTTKMTQKPTTKQTKKLQQTTLTPITTTQ